MHTIYFTRHGQTTWNVENKICGVTDAPLTEKGLAQAAALGLAIQTGGYAIDEILASPLSRAADTARQIAQLTGRACGSSALAGLRAPPGTEPSSGRHGPTLPSALAAAKA